MGEGTPEPSEGRRASRNSAMMHLQDFGGLLTPSTSRASSGMDRYTHRRQSDSHIHPPSRHTRPAPMGVMAPMLERHETQQSLQDVGGLLGTLTSSRGGRLERIASDSAADGAPPHGPPLTSGLSSRSRGPDDIELHDLGGILSSDHEPDASAAGFSRAAERSARQPSPRSQPPTSQPSGGYDAMDIQDPGGLLGK
jgi:hypothetical protein